MSPRWVSTLKFDPDGLIPAIIQDARSKEVLMVAYMNRQAIRKTLSAGITHFYSRSRKRIWMKGEISGHLQRVTGIALDCDKDALLVQVAQTGAACHTGYRSCFFLRSKDGRGWRTVGRKLFDPAEVYGKKPR